MIIKSFISKKIYKVVLLSVFGCVAGVGLLIHTVGAQETADDLRLKISESQRQLDAIEKEIKKYESQLNVVGAEKKTLQSAINQLDLSRDKLKAEIRGTEKRISSTDLEIQELEREIYVKELEIKKNMEAVAESFREVDQVENQTVIEIILGYDSIAEVWDAIEEQSLLQASLRESTRILNELKEEYENARGASLEKRGQLGELKKNLSGEENSLKSTISQKDSLLGQTKNKEAEYQRLLAEKKAEGERFEREMREYESKLQFILNPSTIPVAGSGVLKWPFALGNIPIITQYFGNTAFAQSGAYNGQGHNGVDFGVSIGTPIMAALAGTVVEVNHQAAPNCQYGMWVLVRHGNGLTTLYAHLSSISVAKGQAVSTGQLLGHSGNTGYSTGPHLHFTVYASEALQFKNYTCNSGPTVLVPVSAYTGYQNPMKYL